MTGGPVRIEADGTRVYAKGYRYRPKADHERLYARRKPDDPRAVRWHGTWLLPLETLPEDARTMPETRPDSDAYDHMPWPCRCNVCARPQAARWQRKWRRENGLRP